MLTTKYKQQLKGRAHKLKPIILIGNKGFSVAVKNEIDRALHDHELIKIRIASEDRDERRELAAQICEALNATLIQTIGAIAVVYRKNEDKK